MFKYLTKLNFTMSLISTDIVNNAVSSAAYLLEKLYAAKLC